MSSPPEQTGVSMPSESGDLSCRMYEQRYPEVDDLVVVKVKQIAEMGAYVSLLEYNNIEGMILLSELSRRRIRSINKLIRVGRNEVVVVLRVDKEKGSFLLPAHFSCCHLHYFLMTTHQNQYFVFDSVPEREII
jgi:hypothetical protein